MTQNQKHILLLSSWYPNPSQPYLGNFVKRFAELLSEKFLVSVLFPIADENLKETRIEKITNGNLTEILVFHPKGSHFLSRHRQRQKAFDEGLRQIKNVDLIHAHVILPYGHLFVRAKKYFNCPLIVTEHASYYRNARRKNWSLKEKLALRLIKNQINRLIAVSTFLKKDMQNYFPDQEIFVVPNPVNTELFSPRPSADHNTFNFLHVSTLDPEIKNIQGILDAVQLIVQKGYEEVRLVVISDEPYLKWQQRVNEMGLENYISFKGPMMPEQLVLEYTTSDCFVLFSHYESFSIVIAEAWSCGIPVISTPVGIAYDMPESIGIKVHDNDPLNLAMAMEKVINGHEFDKTMIRQYALQYSDEKILSAMDDIYNSING